MNRSESIKQLAEALAKAQGQMKNAVKQSENPHFRSRYADLAACRDAYQQPLAENGLALIQTTDDMTPEEVVLDTLLTHSSGEWISSRIKMRPQFPTPQGTGSCLQYARRYSACAIIGLAAENEDDDGNEATKGTVTAPPKPAAKPQPANQIPTVLKEPPAVKLDIDWQEVVCHVGSATKDKKLGELGASDLAALQKGFTPRVNEETGEFAMRDLVLHTALRLSLQGVPKNRAPSTDRPAPQDDDLSPRTIAARENAPAREASEAQARFGGGKWRSVVVHFGKDNGPIKGKSLGELCDKSPKNFHFMRCDWKPVPFKGIIDGKDIELRAALDIAHVEYEAAKEASAHNQTHPGEAL